MQRLYGDDWRALLEAQQAEEDDEEEADAAPGVGGGSLSAGASVVGASVASAASAGASATQQRLRQSLLEEFDAAAGTAMDYQQRMDLAMEQLESLGDPVTPVERLKVALQREYGELVAGKALDEQKQQFPQALLRPWNFGFRRDH